jgi:cytochrome P450
MKPPQREPWCGTRLIRPGAQIHTGSTPGCARATPSTGAHRAFGCSPATRTAWRSCATGAGAATAGALSFIQYFAGLINQRRVRPGGDLISRLIQARDHDDALTEGELIATCILLLVAGHETTVSLISGGALALMEHPDQLARFRDDPSGLRSGIEEMLRFVSPVQLTSRIALEDIEVAGIAVRKGDYAMLLIGSANRDPAVFTKPATFNVGRADNPHLGFGHGIHNCLGAPLAKLEAQIALSALLRRTRQLERTSEPLAYKQSIALRGLATFPVTLSAR